MRPEQWSRVKELFEAALARPPAEWPAFFDGLSAFDSELRAEVERLLAAHRDDSFLEGAPDVSRNETAALAGGSEPVEARVGAYRLLQEIGRGGMSTVHLAIRDDDEYKKRVAVKLLKKGMDSDDVVRRFRNERQILAAVEHPSIAKLYDGGTTEGGSPYFVMELVEGRPLDEFCDSRRLSIPERLELFRKVCSAVQVAHQNLVVHRDLKPSNILVTADGEPKLLDFGIAKLLNPELASATLDPTRFQVGLMTPAYASPEQVRGEPITTATDVYSLGVILYELLTGHRPYDVDTGALHQLTRVVCEVEPTRPSQMVGRRGEISGPDATGRKITPETIGRARNDSTDRLRRRLSGDLDNIVMTALRKEPQRRYASVEQLSEDIRRHLEGRPVRARRATLGYRTAKYVGRHRVSLAAAALVVGSLIAFTVVTVQARARAEREALKAEREAAKAQTISEFMQETLAAADPFQGMGREVTVVEALGKAVQELEGSFANQPEVRASIQRTIGSTYRELGRLEEAEPLLVSALETRRQLLGEAHPDVAESLADLGELRVDQGDFADAETLYREALRRHRDLPHGREQVAEDLGGLARSLYFQGRYGAAEPLQREAVRLREELSESPTPELSNVLNDLALIVEARGEFEEAEALYRRTLAIDRERLGPEHPDVATTTSNLGLLLGETRGSEAAEPFLREALAIRRKVLGEHPDTAVSLTLLGQILSDEGDAAGAEQLYREALEMQRRLLGDEHTNMTSTLGSLARELRKAGKLDEAETLYREAITIWRKEVGDVHPGLAVDISSLAMLLAEKGELEEAETLHREACGIFDEVHGPAHWMSGYCSSVLGAFLTERARYEEAEALLLGALPVLRETLGPDHERTLKTIRRLADLYEAWGRPDEAAELQALLPGGNDTGG